MLIVGNHQLFPDAANNSYMDFSELYKIGMKFEPNIYDV